MGEENRIQASFESFCQPTVAIKEIRSRIKWNRAIILMESMAGRLETNGRAPARGTHALQTQPATSWPSPHSTFSANMVTQLGGRQAQP